MTDNEVYNTLSNGGNIALPYLIKISNSTDTVRVTNNNNPITYSGETYAISTFEYTPPAVDGEGGSLSITTIDNDLFNLIEETPNTEAFNIDVISILIKGDEVQALNNYQHFRGSVSVGEDLTAQFSFNPDDRLEMQFPPYKFDTDNNRSNA